MKNVSQNFKIEKIEKIFMLSVKELEKSTCKSKNIHESQNLKLSF